ncbi:hypothetical protein Tco_0627146 [Tanacetum coccineum]|uniref:Uncharacterized protein n=1 Tax=Tanacetum coccineum TaxID=301880 RepID=A0ABQ4WLL1_9ASTR
MSMDDHYNNSRCMNQKLKGCLAQVQEHITWLLCPPHRVSTASTQVNAANFTNIDNLSDAIICAFFASQPNSPQLVHEDLQQIHPDDMEEMDLRCPNWSATTATREDILLRSVELQEIKTTRTRKAQEGVEEGPNYALNRSFLISIRLRVPPPYTGNFMPPTPDLSFIRLDEFVNEPVVEKCKAMSSEEEPKVVRKNDDAPIIKE